MRALRLFLALAVALVLQMTGTSLAPVFALAFDLLLVVLVVQALEGETGWALGAAVIVGLLHDTIQGHAYGLFGVADVVVAYVVAMVAQRVVIQRTTGILLAFFSATVAQQALLLGVSLLVLTEIGPPAFGWILVKASTTALVGAAVTLSARHGGRRYETWKRQRVSRLGFGRKGRT